MRPHRCLEHRRGNERGVRGGSAHTRAATTITQSLSPWFTPSKPEIQVENAASIVAPLTEVKQG